MNKKSVNDNLDKAYEALSAVGIAKDGKIVKTYRGQISTFGAAVTSGSLLTAIAFFCDKGSSSVDRTLLMKAIIHVINKDEKRVTGKVEAKDLYYYVKENNTAITKEEILNAAISLKLAMNLYELVKE